MTSPRPSLVDTVVFGTRDGAPLASVVLVTYDASRAALTRTLEALDRQTESEFELLVVDNGTSHDPESLLHGTDLGGTWFELAENVGPNLARDFAAERAQGDLLVFLDDDAVPADDFVAAHLRAHRRGAVAVRGRVRPLTRSLYNRLATNYDLGDDGFPYLVDIEGNTSVDRSTYLAVGGFGDVPWGHEGLVLTARLLELVERAEVRYDPEPVIYHDYARGFLEFLDVRLRHARAKRDLGDHEQSEVLELYREYTLPVETVTRARLSAILLYVLGEFVDWLTMFVLRADDVVQDVVGERESPRDAILMYHSVGEQGRYGNVSVERFREDISRLVEEYEVVDLPALRTPGGERPRVAITFDDAYANFHDHALPILREFDVPVTLFVPVGLLDGEHPEFASRLERSPNGDPRFNDPEPGASTGAPLMTSEQVRAALETGLVTLGNHTLTHPDLATLPPESLGAEIRGAKRRLEHEFDVTVDRFCYPYGRYSTAALDLVRETHALAVTAEDEPLDPDTDPHRLPRLHGHGEWWGSLAHPCSADDGVPGRAEPAGSYKSNGRDVPVEMRSESTRTPISRPGNEGR